METTVTLDGTVLAAARALAQSSGTSLEEAVVELARRGAAAAVGSPVLRDSYSPLPQMSAAVDTHAPEASLAVRGT